MAVDVMWPVAAGLLISAGLGTVAGRLILYVSRGHQEAVWPGDFLALGLIAQVYGTALLLLFDGFLAWPCSVPVWRCPG